MEGAHLCADGLSQRGHPCWQCDFQSLQQGTPREGRVYFALGEVSRQICPNQLPPIFHPPQKDSSRGHLSIAGRQQIDLKVD